MRWLTVERTVIIVLFLLIFALAFRVPVDTDTWWHLRSGEHILQHGIIYADPFSSTMQDSAWIDHSWGAQVLLSMIWNVGGYAGLALYMAGLATAGMAFVYLMCAGNAYLRSFAVVLGAATAAVFWSPRPQMLSFFLSAVILFILVRYKRGGKDYLWFIPVIMALWGNLHAGFSIGFIFMAAFIAGETLGNVFAPKRDTAVSWRGIRKLILVGVVSVAALCINPYGVQMLTVPFQTINIGALQNFIQEWNSPNFHERQTLPFLALLFLTFGAVGASHKKLDWTDFVLFSGTGYLALNAGRNIAVFAVAVTPMFTVYLNDALIERGWVLRPSRHVSSVGALVNASIILGVCIGAGVKIAAVLSPALVTQTLAELLPVHAVDYLNESAPAGNLFNSYNWGGYLTYFAHEYPVFVDGRTDLYGDSFLSNDYLDTALGREGWDTTLDQYDINTVLIEANGGLARALRDDAAWRVVYEDDLAALFVRQTLLLNEAGDG